MLAGLSIWYSRRTPPDFWANAGPPAATQAAATNTAMRRQPAIVPSRFGSAAGFLPLLRMPGTTIEQPPLLRHPAAAPITISLVRAWMRLDRRRFLRCNRPARPGVSP